MEWPSKGLSGVRTQKSEWWAPAVIRGEDTLVFVSFSSLDLLITRLKGRTYYHVQSLLWILNYGLTNFFHPHQTTGHSPSKHTKYIDLLPPLCFLFVKVLTFFSWKSLHLQGSDFCVTSLELSLSRFIQSDWVLPPQGSQDICTSVL